MRILTLILLITISSFSFGQDKLVQTVNEAQESLRNQLDTLKYDGKKVTYFKYRNQTYYKSVKVPIFLRDNYLMFFSGAAADDKVSIEFYNKPPESNNRLLLFEIKNISGDEAIVDVRNLRQRLGIYGKSPDELRSVFVDYKIKRSRSNRGAIVLVLGY